MLYQSKYRFETHCWQKLYKRAFFVFMVLAATMAFFYWAIPAAIEKELHRQEVVRQYHCQKYADDIASWAKRKGIENPCK